MSSPTGAAPARQSLMPLYCAGLWQAVNIAPGRVERARRRSRRGRSTPARGRRRRRPRASTPSANAADESAPTTGACRAPTRTRGGAGERGEGVADRGGRSPSSSSSGTMPADVVGLEDRVERSGVTPRGATLSQGRLVAPGRSRPSAPRSRCRCARPVPSRRHRGSTLDHRLLPVSHSTGASARRVERLARGGVASEPGTPNGRLRANQTDAGDAEQR